MKKPMKPYSTKLSEEDVKLIKKASKKMGEPFSTFIRISALGRASVVNKTD